MLGHPERTAPHRPGLETCAAVGMMDGLRRPISAFEAPAPDVPVAPAKVSRWLCILCGQTADDPLDLCEPIAVS